jgi:hypothetical protein
MGQCSIDWQKTFVSARVSGHLAAAASLFFAGLWILSRLFSGI